MSNIQIIETVTYRLNANADEAAFVAAANDLAAYLKRCGGVVSRAVYKDAANQWHETMVWESKAAYEAATGGFMASPEGQAVVAHIDPTTLEMAHFPAEAAFVPEREAA